MIGSTTELSENVLTHMTKHGYQNALHVRTESQDIINTTVTQMENADGQQQITGSTIKRQSHMSLNQWLTQNQLQVPLTK